MRIVKQGERPMEKPLRGRCSGCGCVVECVAGEVKHDPDPRERGDPYVDCPTAGCDKWIWLKPGKAPA